VQSLREHGNTLAENELRELLALDNELNAQGMAVWLNKRASRKAGAIS
jgi:hypothetical protein